MMLWHNRPLQRLQDSPRAATLDAKATQGLRMNEVAFQRIRAERPINPP